MPFATVSGEQVFYAYHHSQSTKALTVVLLHGAGGSHLSWPTELRRLPGANVYLPDLPAHGRSTGQPRFTIKEYADAILQWLHLAKVQRPILVGHSMGGAIALDIALRLPNLIQGLILINSAAHFTIPPAIIRDLEVSPGHAIDQIVALAFPTNAPPSLVDATRTIMRAVPPVVIRADFAACAAFDVRHRLRELCLPTCIIASEADCMTPPGDAHFLANSIPGAQFRLLPDSAHMSVLTDPAAVRDEIVNFLLPYC